MAKKTSKSKKVTASFLREVNALAAKHGIANVLVAQIIERPRKMAAGRALTAADDGCPAGKTLRRVQFKDQFGRTITTDICL